ncbi:hypothetical protein HOLleu_27427 [Holothuria leucospilota]|uniref:Transposase domain-containing protein n=1 Tax=Holothuria leucospilota TaxID=206669 RepID=A0A9Q1H3H6_HOLLE|nr:hypothetical protein HOLleu_27427 [Holothuria leucospilota]
MHPSAHVRRTNTELSHTSLLRSAEPPAWPADLCFSLSLQLRIDPRFTTSSHFRVRKSLGKSALEKHSSHLGKPHFIHGRHIWPRDPSVQRSPWVTTHYHQQSLRAEYRVAKQVGEEFFLKASCVTDKFRSVIVPIPLIQLMTGCTLIYIIKHFFMDTENRRLKRRNYNKRWMRNKREKQKNVVFPEETEPEVGDVTTVTHTSTCLEAVVELPEQAVGQNDMQNCSVVTDHEIPSFTSSDVNISEIWDHIDSEYLPVETSESTEPEAGNVTTITHTPTCLEAVVELPEQAIGQNDMQNCSIITDHIIPSLTNSDVNVSEIWDRIDSEYLPVETSESSDSSDSDSGRDTFEEGIRDWANKFEMKANALDQLLKFLKDNGHPNLPTCSRTLLKTPREVNVKSVSDMEYFHFGLMFMLEKVLEKYPEAQLHGKEELSLALNVDGLPLFKSTNASVWPVLCCIDNLSPTVVFPVSIAVGKSKPSNNNFLQDTISDLNALISQGFCHRGQMLQISLKSIICDAPARAMVKCIKLYSGYYGCDKCSQKGLYLGRMTYPISQSKDLVPRTDFSFRNEENPNHHTGISPLIDLANLNMVDDFPVDYMHSVCLGVTRRLLLIWLRGPRGPHRLSASQAKQISDNLKSLSCHVPQDFARKPRGLLEIDRWKATEFRQFLLYTGQLVLKPILSVNCYKHFMALSVAVCILVSPTLVQKYSEYAQNLLEYFVITGAEMYGPEFLVYNVHSLVHLPDQAQKFGSLDNCAAWQFENYMQKIKRKVRKIMTFTVVIFVKDNTVECVPSSWVKKHENKVICYWPSSCKDIKRKITKCTLPDEKAWAMYPVRIIGQPVYPDYQSAAEIAKKAEVTSDVESTKRQVKRPGRFLNTSDSESGEEGIDSPDIIHNGAKQLPEPPSLDEELANKARSSRGQSTKSGSSDNELLPDANNDQRTENKEKSGKRDSTSNEASLAVSSISHSSEDNGSFDDISNDYFEVDGEVADSDRTQEILDALESISKRLTRVDEASREIVKLLKVEQAKRDGLSVEDLLPGGQPAVTEDDLKKIEESLEDEVWKRKMINVLVPIATGHDLGKAARAVMRATISNSVMSLYSFRGQKGGKKPFKETTLCRIILKCLRKVFPGASEKNITFEVGEVLRHAPNKPGGSNYEKKVNYIDH